MSKYINSATLKEESRKVWTMKSFDIEDLSEITPICCTPYNNRAVAVYTHKIDEGKLYGVALVNIIDGVYYKITNVGDLRKQKKPVVDCVKFIQRTNGIAYYDSIAVRCDICGETKETWGHVIRNHADGSRRKDDGGSLELGLLRKCPKCTYESDIKGVLDAMDKYALKYGEEKLNERCHGIK